MILKDKNENRLEFQNDPLLILDFTGRYDTIRLDLGNNFTDTHFIKAFSECYEFEQIMEYLTNLEFDLIIKFIFVGNYCNVSATYYLPEFFDLIENL